MESVKNMIKNNEYPDILLFHGEEQYMLEFYLKKVVDGIIGSGDKTMNHTVIDDKKATIETVQDMMDTLPFFADCRVVVLNQLGLFEKNRSSFSNDLISVIDKKSSATYVIIVETACDKRTKLYKHLKSNGKICEFGHLSESELIKYIARHLGKYGKKIDTHSARYLIEHVGNKLSVIHNEVEKLSHYMGEVDVVSREDIHEICQKSVENKIFELVDCMGTKRRSRAIKLYHDMLASKEPANRILFMMVRQFRLNYKVKLLNGEGLPINTIASKLKLQPFIAKKCFAQSQGFTIASLESSLEDCMQAEIDIRTGVFSPELAVEQLIIKYSG